MTVYANSGSILGSSDVQQVSWFPAKQKLYGLVEIKKNDSSGSSTGTTKSRWGLLMYAQDGSLASAAPLNLSLLPFRLAALPSGKLVISGEDLANHSPELIELDKDGGNIVPLNLAGSGRYSPQALGRFYTGMDHDDRAGTAVSHVVSSMQLVPYGDDVLLVQSGTNYPLTVIGDGGILRSLQLRLPSGVLIDSVLPSSQEELYVRLIDERHGSQARDERHPAEPNLLVVFDSAGNPLRQISTSSVPFQSIACEADGRYLAFKLSSDKNSEYGRWTLVTAAE